jgi:hypothetical protein
MYHLELRQFPHNLCRFNLTREELRPIVEPWAQDHWIELGQRKWSPQQAKLTILEGPRIPVEQLSMGRGWRQAQRHGTEATERLLAEVRATGSAAIPVPSNEASLPAELLADSLGLELLTLLEGDPAPLARSWALASARCPERPASECLALAEQAVRSLLRARLIVLVRGAPDDAGNGGDGERGGAVPEDELEAVLMAAESWAAPGQSARVRMHRA